MRRSIVAFLLLVLAMPAYAKTHIDEFNIPCGSLWPAIKDTLSNSDKFVVVNLNDADRTASFSAGGHYTVSRINSVALIAQGNHCEMQTQTSVEGWGLNDAGDFKKQVKQSLAKLQSNPPAQPESAPSTAPVTPVAGLAQGSKSSSHWPGSSVQSNGGTPIETESLALPASVAPAAEPAIAPGSHAQANAGARMTLTVAAHCAKDPDPTGFFGSSFYSTCKQRELDDLRSWIASALADRHVVVANGNEGGDYRVTVTLTKSMDKRPSSFMPFGDFAPGTVMYEASYQIVDSAGRVVNSGTVAHQGSDSHPADLQKQFAVKIADTLNQKLATQGSAAAGGSPTTDAPLTIDEPSTTKAPKPK